MPAAHSPSRQCSDSPHTAGRLPSLHRHPAPQAEVLRTKSADKVSRDIPSDRFRALRFCVSGRDSRFFFKRFLLPYTKKTKFAVQNVHKRPPSMLTNVNTPPPQLRGYLIPRQPLGSCWHIVSFLSASCTGIVSWLHILRPPAAMSPPQSAGGRGLCI